MRQELIELANNLRETSSKNNMTPQQTRLLKTCIVMLLELSQTENEDEFFSMAKDVFQNVAAIMKHSHFHNTFSKANKIAYAEQAVELSIETLNDELYSKKLKKYDQ